MTFALRPPISRSDSDDDGDGEGGAQGSGRGAGNGDSGDADGAGNGANNQHGGDASGGIGLASKLLDSADKDEPTFSEPFFLRIEVRGRDVTTISPTQRVTRHTVRPIGWPTRLCPAVLRCALCVYVADLLPNTHAHEGVRSDVAIHSHVSGSNDVRGQATASCQPKVGGV